MKKLFNHRKRPYEDKINYEEWEELLEDEEDEYDSEESYSAEAVYESEEGYSAEGEYESEEGYNTEGGYESEESYNAEGEYDSEEGYSSEGEYDPEEIYYTEDGMSQSEEGDDSEEAYASGDDDYEEEDYDPRAGYFAAGYTQEEEMSGWLNDEDGIRPVKKHKKKKRRSFGVMDTVITCTGVIVLILALVAGSLYADSRIYDRQVESFISVGSQLANISLPGESGLMAVADAEAAKKAAAEALAQLEKEQKEKEEREKEKEKEYNEQEYTNRITVDMNMSSIQNDLKIKFLNRKTGKLISNVPFEVTVTDPEGKTHTWSDDDMDGIIYKTKLTAGKYEIKAIEFTKAKYKDYFLPPSARSAEVKKDIEYKKVDVKNEIKTEAEVNVTKEDTKKNETQVENKLENTVTWVESTTKPVSYREVEKVTILDPLKLTDPLQLAYHGSFTRLSQVLPGYGISESSKSLKSGEKFTLKASVQGVNVKNIVWSSSNPTVATVTPVEGSSTEAVVTAVGAGSAAISYQVNGTAVSGGDTIANQQGATCMVTVAPKEVLTKGTVTLDKTDLSVGVMGTVTVKAVAAGFTTGKELAYKVASSKEDIVKVTCDAQGNIDLTGVAEGEADVTVTVNYKAAGTDGSSGTASSGTASADTAAVVTAKVKVVGKLALALEKEAAVVYVGHPLVLKAKLTNALTGAAMVAESSDPKVATVTVKDKDITVTGVAAGSTVITVKYLENKVEVKAVCAVTVRPDPKLDKTTKLKDLNDNQIYVREDDVYREAVYADYYTAEKFYVKGNVTYTGWQTIDGKVYFFDASGKKVTGEQVIQGAKYNFGEDGALYTGTGIRGIDVSKWNGNIDWKAVKNSGIEYVIIRCGYRGSSKGALIEDPKYQSNIKGATEAGLKVGVYFFTQAVSEAEAVEEASMVLEQVKNYKLTFPIFLDVEASGGRADSLSKEERTAICKAFCQTIQSAGYTAGIYANKLWLENKMDAGALSTYKIWLAQYAPAPTYTGRYDMWQYQATGKVSGISGDVDMNWSYLGY